MICCRISQPGSWVSFTRFFLLLSCDTGSTGKAAEAGACGLGTEAALRFLLGAEAGVCASPAASDVENFSYEGNNNDMSNNHEKKPR